MKRGRLQVFRSEDCADSSRLFIPPHEKSPVCVLHQKMNSTGPQVRQLPEGEESSLGHMLTDGFPVQSHRSLRESK